MFLGPEGLVGKYRKTHLPYLGVDRFVVIVVTPGEYELPLFTGRRPELYAAIVERWG